MKSEDIDERFKNKPLFEQVEALTALLAQERDAFGERETELMVDRDKWRGLCEEMASQLDKQGHPDDCGGWYEVDDIQPLKFDPKDCDCVLARYTAAKRWRRHS